VVDPNVKQRKGGRVSVGVGGIKKATTPTTTPVHTPAVPHSTVTVAPPLVTPSMGGAGADTVSVPSPNVGSTTAPSSLPGSTTPSQQQLIKVRGRGCQCSN